MGIQEANLKRTRAAKNRRFVQVWKGKGTSPRSYPIDYGPDDETPKGNRDALDLALKRSPHTSEGDSHDKGGFLFAALTRVPREAE